MQRNIVSFCVNCALKVLRKTINRNTFLNGAFYEVRGLYTHTTIDNHSSVGNTNTTQKGGK